MKKIFYILDPNGEFYSTDRTKRYIQLTGQALYAYGYKNDPADKNHFIVDEEISWVIEYIFDRFNPE